MKVISPKQLYEQKTKELHKAFLDWNNSGNYRIESEEGKKYLKLRKELEKHPLRIKFKEKLGNLFK